MASKGGREKIKLESTAGTGHFYTTDKNKKTTPEKLEFLKFDPKARKLLEKDKVASVMGCYTSASRKAVLPVFEKLKGLLYYPTYYEGLEQSQSIVYTGATPNQNVIPAIHWAIEELKVKRLFIANMPLRCILWRCRRWVVF